MELLKKADRIIERSLMAKALKVSDIEVEEVQEFDKWKTVGEGIYEGSKIQVKLTLIKAEGKDKTFYYLCDSLNRVATIMIEDANEILDWLKEHGYKTDKEWYMTENGMSEETWNEWNK